MGTRKQGQKKGVEVIMMGFVADRLFEYLNDVIHDPANARLDVSELPGEFRDFALGLRHFAQSVTESRMFALSLSQGDLHCKVPPRGNELAAPLKALHASLKHMTWQTKQVAKGDYSQRMMFMGEFAEAFNRMTQKLEERSAFETKERSRLQDYINLILANTPDMLVVFDVAGKAVLTSRAFIRNSLFASACEVRGKTFQELFEDVTTGAFVREISGMFQCAARDRRTFYTTRSLDLSRSGTPCTYSIHVTPMLYEIDVVTGILVVFHGVDARSGFPEVPKKN